MGVLVLQGIQNVEEVLTRRQATLGIFVREILHELLVLLHHGPEQLDAEFIIGWDPDELHFAEGHELLLFLQYQLQVILVDCVIWRYI